jgi:release factor glutamine methyltransferase
MTTLRTAFHEGVRFLNAHGLHDAYFEARFLFQHTIGIELSHLYSNPERPLTQNEASALRQALAMRAAGWPAAYITGKREFYGLEFCVNQKVLIPRPETELLVDKALDFASAQRDKKLVIADIGTGSGAIAIALATRLPAAMLFAVDISRDALDVAELNAARLDVADRIKFLHGDLLEPLPGPVDLITANLPYIPDGDVETLPKEVSLCEPRIALAGGKDGLEIIRRFLEQSPGKVCPGGCIVMEIGADQAKAVLAMVDTCLPGAKVELFRDPNGLDRTIRVILN